MRKLGLIVGAIIGTVAGVLFAPRSGKNLRKRIKEDLDKGGSGLNPLKEDAKIVGKDIAETFNEVKESASVKKAVNEGKKKVNKAIKDAEKSVKKAAKDAVKYGKKEAEKLKKKVSGGAKKKKAAPKKKK